MGMPMSLREKPKDLASAKIINDFVFLRVKIPLRKEFADALKEISPYLLNMRTSLDMFGVYYVGKMATDFPFILPKLSIDMLTDKYTTIFSNLHACKKSLVFNGKNQLGQFYFVPVVGKLNSGISLFTAGNHMTLACMSDDSAITNSRELIEIFERKNQEILGS